MEREKVKEIKKALEQTLEYCARELERKLFQDCLTLINELESENERLNKSEFESYQELDNASAQIHSLEEHIAEYLQENQQLKDRIAKLENIGLNENITVGEYLREMQRLKDRVAELENEKKEYGKRKFLKAWKLGIEEFAERLKEKLNDKIGYDRPYVMRNIEETLKEFINDK